MPIITPFDPWKNTWCTCPPKYSLSAYTGCGHKCLYCYASSYIRNFFMPRPKRDVIIQLQKDLKKIPAGTTITIANSSDPYQPLEKTCRLTRSLLTILKDHHVNILIVTKSASVLDDISILRQCKNIVVCITLTTLNNSLAQTLEPYACSPLERLNAITALSSYIPTVCRLDPLIYPLNIDEIETIVHAVASRGAKQIITSTYKARPDNYKRMCMAFPAYEKKWDELYHEHGEKIGGSLYLPLNLREKFIIRVKTAALKNNIAFSSCREGLETLNTLNCDGSSLLS